MTDKYCVLYNPLAGNGRGEGQARALEGKLKDSELRFVDITRVESYEDFFASLEEREGLILCGGDGTINRFVNQTVGIKLPENLLYYACGSGNDFLRDTGMEQSGGPFLLTPYLQHLPKIRVQGKEEFFINGIGYGIDGYCCEKGDELREKSDKPVNYTAIAIEGLLLHYHPTHATITVDGSRFEMDKVWLAPTMLGRYYGGGMMPTPDQDRFSVHKELSLMLYHGTGKLKTLAVFPTIFKGEHIKHKEMVQVLKGRHIKVEFDRPTPLQIDGETVSGVTEYEAFFPEEQA